MSRHNEVDTWQNKDVINMPHQISECSSLKVPGSFMMKAVVHRRHEFELHLFQTSSQWRSTCISCLRLRSNFLVFRQFIVLDFRLSVRLDSSMKLKRLDHDTTTISAATIEYSVYDRNCDYAAKILIFHITESFSLDFIYCNHGCDRHWLVTRPIIVTPNRTGLNDQPWRSQKVDIGTCPRPSWLEIFSLHVVLWRVWILCRSVTISHCSVKYSICFSGFWGCTLDTAGDLRLPDSFLSLPLANSWLRLCWQEPCLVTLLPRKFCHDTMR